MVKILTPDICVIGAGPGGLAVATGAAAYGVRVVLVDKGPTGSVEPNRGTLPSWALSAAARQAQAMRTGAAFGIAEADPEIDFKAVMAHVREVAAGAAPAFSAERLATLGVTVIKAEARFIGRRRLIAGDTEIRARRYVLATGSAPIVPAIPGIEEIGCLTSDTVFQLGRRPGHLIILGGSSTGLELAQAFRRLGSQVTVLEASTVLPGEDPEMAAVVVRKLRAEGVIIREGVKATAVERRGKTSVRVLIETEAGAGEVDGSHLLAAAGRTPDIGSLDLKKARVAVKAKCDRRQRHAANDKPQDLRHRRRDRRAAVGTDGDASCRPRAQGAAVPAACQGSRLRAAHRPYRSGACTCRPDRGAGGQTPQEAHHPALALCRERPRARRAQDRKVTSSSSRRRNGDILGVTIAGAGASELIDIWTLALSNGLGLKDMASSIPPHPTMGEIGKSAAIAYFADKARKPLARGVVRLLQLFG